MSTAAVAPRRLAAHTDTISGILIDVHRTPIAAEVSFIPQDMMANEQQGAIVIGTLENLGVHDRVVAAMRRMYFEAMDAVARGEDPKHIIRDPGHNAKRLDLDFAGIDCTITPDGQILLFEANATMLVQLEESREDFPYKHKYIPKISEAIDRLVVVRLQR